MSKLIEYFVRFPIWSNAIIAIFVVAGLVAFFSLKMSFFPEDSNRTVIIQVVYPGASPEEMEEGVTLKVEDAMRGIEGIDEIKSVSSENLASVNIKWVEGYDEDRFLADVKNAVDRISSFPVDAEKPVVYKQPDLGRAVTVVLTGDTDLNTLKEKAELVEDEFLASGLISQVSLSGFPAREISIEVSEDQLTRYGLTIAQISNGVRINNTNITGGSIRSREEEILIRANAKGYTPEELGGITLISNKDGNRILLRDVASSITEQFAESPNKTMFNGKPALSISVNKLITEDLIDITNYVEEYAEEFNYSNDLIQMEYVSDSSIGLRQRLNLLVNNGVIGLILVLFALGFFLSFRLSFWVAFGIPFSFLGMFVVVGMLGVTINMLSLFGMILAIGILVDDGIVVGENIFSHIEKGKSPLRAAVDGSMEVLPSVFTSVATTIIVFSAFFFLSGDIANFLRDIAIIMVASLAFSLVECTLVLPSHLSHAANQKKPPRFRKYFDAIIDFLKLKLYGLAMGFILRNRAATLFIPVFLFLVTMGLMNGGIIQSTFFPFIEGDQTSISLVMKPGTREMVVEGHILDMEKKVWELNDHLADSLGVDSIIKNTRIEIGSGLGESGSHAATLNIALLEGEERPIPSDGIERMLRARIPVVAGSEKMVIGGARTFGKPISVSLIGRDLATLESAKEMLKEELRSFSVLKDIIDNEQVGKREVQIELKPRAYALGLTHGDVASQVRQGFFGAEAQRLQKGDDEVRVWVRYPESGRMDLGRLEEMKIKTALGESYPFTEVANYSIGRGIVAINHYDGAREIKVEADLADQSVAVSPLFDEIKADVIPKVLEAHPGVRVEYLGQAQRQQELMADAPLVFAIALFLMFLILTLTFRSLPQALTMIPLIMLGLMGAIWGHGIHGKPISLLSMFGLLAVTGIVINDAVVFVSKFNLNLKEGMKVKSAVVSAGLARFRPILLTSITTVAGLYPLILAQSRQAQFLIPMAISVVYGVLFGTLFILLFLPAILLALNELRWLLHWFWTGEKVAHELVEPAVREMMRQKDHNVEFSGAYIPGGNPPPIESLQHGDSYNGGNGGGGHNGGNVSQDDPDLSSEDSQSYQS